MKKTLLVIALLSVATLGQTVQVSQGFLDDATKSFRETRALREALIASEKVSDALLIASTAKDEALKAKDEVIKAKDEKLAIQEQTIETYRKIKCDKTSFFWGLIKNTRCK